MVNLIVPSSKDISGIHPYFVNMCLITAVRLMNHYRDPVTFCCRKSYYIFPLNVLCNRLLRCLFISLPESYGIVSDQFRRYPDPLLCLPLAGQRDLDRIMEIGIESQMHFRYRLSVGQMQCKHLSFGSTLAGDPQVPVSILISGNAVDYIFRGTAFRAEVAVTLALLARSFGSSFQMPGI